MKRFRAKETQFELKNKQKKPQKTPKNPRRLTWTKNFRSIFLIYKFVYIYIYIYIIKKT